jgi:hypothetical protein
MIIAMSEPGSAAEPQDFSLVRVLVFAWRVLRQHFWALLVPSLCSGILLCGFIALLELSPRRFGLAFSLWGIFVGVIITIGVYRSLLRWSRGEDRPTVGGVFSLGLRGWWDGIRVGTVIFLFSLFLSFLLSLCFELLGAFLSGSACITLAVVFFVWLLSRCFLSMICMADEDQGALDAVHRSLALTEGRFVRIALSFLLLATAFIGFNMAMSFGFYWLQRPFPAPACTLAFAILSEPFVYAFVFAVYLELKNLQKPAWTPGPAPTSGQAPSPAPQDGI